MHGINLYTVLIRHFLLCPCVFTLGEKNGLVLSAVDSDLLRSECAAGTRHRKFGEAVMTFYIIGAIAALFLMVYLVIALLKPELFS
jgi:K+-transporting ATPase KdpF subunit